MTVYSKITSKGQTTIPISIREALGIKPGDEVTYEVNDGKVSIYRRRSALEFAGVLYDSNRKPLTIEEMNSAWQEAAVERYERSRDRD